MAQKTYKYRIGISNWGSECVAGIIPDNIWKYIQDECEGDFDIYKEKFEEDEVPEEFKLADDIGSLYDADSFFHESGPYSNGTITIYNEDGTEELMTIEAKDIPSDTEYCSGSESDGRPYFVWESVEKGSWFASPDFGENVIETTQPFDKSKLKLNLVRLSYSNDDYCHEFIRTIEYDEEVLELEAETRGKSYELDFYKDTNDEEAE